MKLTKLKYDTPNWYPDEINIINDFNIMNSMPDELKSSFYNSILEKYYVLSYENKIVKLSELLYWNVEHQVAFKNINEIKNFLKNYHY